MKKKSKSQFEQFENLPNSLNISMSVFNDLLEKAKQLENDVNTPYKHFECSWRSWELDCSLSYQVVAKTKAEAKKCLKAVVPFETMVKDTLSIKEKKILQFPFIAEHEFDFDNDF
jgi:hypothetical protein